MLRNLSLLAWTQGQILEAHVGFATSSAVSGPLWGTSLYLFTFVFFSKVVSQSGLETALLVANPTWASKIWPCVHTKSGRFLSIWHILFVLYYKYCSEIFQKFFILSTVQSSKYSSQINMLFSIKSTVHQNLNIKPEKTSYYR